MVWSDCLHGFALDWVSPLTALNVTFIYFWSWDFGILFEAALKDQDDDEKMLSAQIMWKILMGFTTEADACKPKPSGALPSAATKKAAALPSAAAIQEGDIVTGRAHKFKDKFDNVKCFENVRKSSSNSFICRDSFHITFLVDFTRHQALLFGPFHKLIFTVD